MDVVKCLVITAEYVVIFYLQCRNSIVRYCIYFDIEISVQIFDTTLAGWLYVHPHPPARIFIYSLVGKFGVSEPSWQDSPEQAM